MRQLLLVTCAQLPDGEPEGHLLLDACGRHDIAARWVAWDEPDVDWTAGLVAVRATWDYDSRREEFLAWVRQVPDMLNSAEVFAWNTDKAYLVGLAAAGVPVVPTVSVDGEESLPSAIAEVSLDGSSAVVKPRVGAGGRGVVVFDGEPGGPAGLDESALGPGPWVVQPLVESVRTDGEWSIFVLGAEVVSVARKLPAPGEIRVHEEYGGHTVARDLDDEAVALARRTLEAARDLVGPLDYARVDAMRLADGTLVVSELEVTEPGLYLDVLPGNAEEFVSRVVLPRLDTMERSSR